MRMRIFEKADFNKLAAKLKKGNKSAGEEIFDYFNPKIFSFFMARTGHIETSEDLSQEVFLKIVSKIETFNEESGNFLGWVWQIARNTLIDYYRGKKPLPLLSPELMVKDAHSPDYADKEKVDEIIRLVKNFSGEEQEIFSLRYLSGIPYKELAQMTNKSEINLRVIVHRLNQKIKNIINND